MQVGDLRLALQRAEQAAARKEDYLRHEISELQQVRPVLLEIKKWPGGMFVELGGLLPYVSFAMQLQSTCLMINT